MSITPSYLEDRISQIPALRPAGLQRAVNNSLGNGHTVDRGK